MEQWRASGVPEVPRAWIIQTARHKAIDRIRRQARLEEKLIDALAAAGELDRYHLLHATRADLLRRLGSPVEAARSYAQALALVTNAAERRFLERRLRELRPPQA